VTPIAITGQINIWPPIIVHSPHGYRSSAPRASQPLVGVGDEAHRLTARVERQTFA
jgi:hypothetical protein